MKRIKRLLIAFFTLCTVCALGTAAAVDGVIVDPELIFNPQTTLTVYIDGTASDMLTANYPYGEVATLSAPNVDGKTFQYWTNAEGTVIDYNKNVALTMYANTSVNAVYGASDAIAKTTAAFVNVTRTDGEILFNAIASAQGDISEAGIRYSTTKKTLKDLKGAEDVTVEKADDTSANWTLIVTPDDEDTVYYAVAYATVGTETTYSAVKEVKLSELRNGVSMVLSLGDLDLSALNAEFCVVSFEPNGGEGVMATQGIVKGEATVLNANTFTREGYTFDGWKTEANGGTHYADGVSVTFDVNTTLYAQWKANSNGGSSSHTATPNPQKFVDVPAGNYYENAVDWAVEKGITTGTDATHFSPNASCTRAQMVTFLWRAAGSPETTKTVAFSDVAGNAYYAKAVQWAAENGITLGTSATTFSPDATVTRAQTVTFLFRALKGAANGANPFTDVAEGAFYTDAVQWAVAEGITTGTSATTFSPANDCLRAQIVTFLYRAYSEK